MATEAQFASLDGTALEGETVDFRADEKALARRSISIFSRRGIEDTPEPRPPFIAQAAMRTPREMSERQKRWLKRRSAPVQSSSPKKPRGTVLNAVPAAKTIQMTPLEEEMASSPNEEILSAMESPSSTRLPSASPTTPQSGVFWAKKDGSPSQRTPKSSKRSSANTRIGVWMNGIAHWDENARPERSAGSEEPSLPATGFTPIQPIPAEQLNALRGTRPQLSVLIPGSEPLVNDTTISTIVRNSEMPARTLVSVAPANIVSKFASTAEPIPDDNHVVSPLETVTASTPPQIVVETEDGAKKNVSRQSRSSSSEVSLVERDDTSSYSRRSSATSIEVEHGNEHELKANFKQNESKASTPVVSPLEDGTKGVPNLDKPLPPPPINNDTPEQSPSSPAKEIPRLRHVSSTRSEPISRSKRPSKSWRTIELESVDPESARSSSYLLSVSAPPSPTLSQAERALEAELSLPEEKDEEATEPPTKRASIRRGDSVRSVMQPPERAPTVPRRSRKREWRLSRDVKYAVVQPAKPHDPRRRRSEADLHGAQDDCAAERSLRKTCSVFDLNQVGELARVLERPIVDFSTLPQVAYEDGLIVLEGPVTLQKVMDDAALTTASAEDVLLHILEALASPEDLFNTAAMNKGMYRVYKENEMHLIRSAVRNQSLPAWELREWCPPEPNNAVPQSAASSQLEHTPISYMRGHRRDLDTISRLKSLILSRCQTFLRPETALALADPDHPSAARFNDAFHRISTFCAIFGSGKNREEDITGQLDWLKGGLLANTSDLSATMNMNLEFEMSSVLLNAPEHFAKGNAGGLGAAELYDMTELWTCLTALLQPYQGQTRQAMRYGVFDDCELFDGDEEREEYLLEEWTAHILTLGPAVILEMGDRAEEHSSQGFAIARANGWTTWSPPQYSACSRTSFLKEPVSRLYEERVAAATLSLQHGTQQREKKEQSRKRVATLAAEIRLARQSSTYKRLPLIDQSNEKAMSMLSRHGSTRSTFSFHSPSSSPGPSSPPAREPSQPPLSRSASISARRQSRAPHFSTPRPLEPKTLIHSQHHRRKISPIIEDKVETFNRLSIVHPSGAGLGSATYTGAAGAVLDTSEAAIRRITDMGFTRAEASRALRETDMGDGLRVDRAVDVLLRGM